MEFKKKTIIWEDNNEPPKNYIWVKSDGNAYEFNHTTRQWEKIMSSNGGSSSGCPECSDSVPTSTTEYEAAMKNGKVSEIAELNDGESLTPLYNRNYSEPQLGDWVSSRKLNGVVEFEIVTNPFEYEINEFERCGQIYKILEKKTPVPNKEMHYTTVSGNIITLNWNNIVNNTYTDGVGVIEFTEDLTSIPTSAFQQNNDLLTLEMPDSVTTIERRAFDKCKSLKGIHLSSTLTTIGEKAFNECSALEYITLPDSLHTLDSGAFRRCRKLKTVKLPEGILELQAVGSYSGVFQDCDLLEFVQLPSTLKEIGQDCFADCVSLKSIYIPKDVINIYNSAGGDIYPAFNGCTALEEMVVDPRNVHYYSGDGCNEYNGIFSGTSLIRGCKTTILPDNITTIGYGAFSKCWTFTNIELPESVTTLSDWCFTMTGLNSIHIPINVNSISPWAFANCPDMETMTVDPNNETYTSQDGNGNECNCIITTDGYDNIVLVSGCKNTTIPTTVVAIGDGAFNNQSKMTSITIPSSVTSISGNEVFNGCAMLAEVNYTGTIAEFQAINQGQGWRPWDEFLVPCTVVHCSDGDVLKQS